MLCVCVSLEECLGPRQQRQRIGQIEANGGKPSKLQMQILVPLLADASPRGLAEQVTIEAPARHKAPRTWITRSTMDSFTFMAVCMQRRHPYEDT